MSEQLVMTLGQDALKTAAMIGGPILIASLVVGLVVSIFQAVTQINEATLSFIPKLVVVGLVLVLAGPWMMDVMSRFTTNLFDNIATYVRE